jgi:hypothetical protein
MSDPALPFRAPRRLRPSRTEAALGLAVVPLLAWIGLTRMTDGRELVRGDERRVATAVDYTRGAAPGLDRRRREVRRDFR